MNEWILSVSVSVQPTDSLYSVLYDSGIKIDKKY